MSPNRQFYRFSAKNNYLHVSAPIVANPARAIEMATKGHSLLPELIVGLRKTYNVGNNAAKRAYRAIHGVRK